jgi:hypothetical protein
MTAGVHGETLFYGLDEWGDAVEIQAIVTDTTRYRFIVHGPSVIVSAETVKRLRDKLNTLSFSEGRQQ